MTRKLTDAAVVSSPAHLYRSLGRMDMILLTIAATIGIDTIAQIAGSGGAQAFTWAAVLVATFMFPYALVMSELGSTFTQEGGPYVWVRLAYGKFAAAISTLLYWVTNPIWLGGSLAFISVATWNSYVARVPEGSAGDYIFKLGFIWVAILIAVVSLRFGKWILNVGGIVKVAILAFFVVTVVLYALQNGVHGYAVGDFSPTLGGFLGVTPILLFAFVGFEAQNGAAAEMRNPQRDVPRSIGVSAVVSALAYLVPIFAILAVLPASKVSGASGLLDAMGIVFSVYGPAAQPLLVFVAVVFIFVVLTQGAAWMVASDRVQAMAGDGGAFPRFFGVFHKRLGTPVRVNVLSGIVASAFTVAATLLVHGTAAALFTVVLTMAITTLLVSYLLIFPTIVTLRKKYLDVHRPYRVPGGRVGLLLCTGVIYAWVLLGSWVALFPGTIENALGIHYDFFANWGVSRSEFEVFTLGTLIVLLVLAVAGYAWARLRDRQHGFTPAENHAQTSTLNQPNGEGTFS